MNKYGECKCGTPLVPIFFTEFEYAQTSMGIRYKTGRHRRAVSHLLCENCGRQYPIDDSFDGPWEG